MTLRPPLLALALLLPSLTWSARARGAEVLGETLALQGDRMMLAVPAEPVLEPGGTVAIYVEERRPDPRGGELVGLRYAGDASLVWVGPGVVELALAEGAAAPATGQVLLGPARGLPPTPPWSPPPPPPPPVVEAPPPPVAVAQPTPRPSRPPALPGISEDLDGRPLGTVHADQDAATPSVRLWGGYAADGYGTGAGLYGAAWRLRPAQGPGLVEIGLETLRGERWAEGEDEGERWAREAVAGAWLWTRVDTAGVGLAGIFGAGLGVDAEGLALATLLGLRTGDPDLSRVELLWERRGDLGQRLSLDGRVAVVDPLRIGLRARLGDLPQHDGDARQLRSDGALLLSWDALPALTLTVAGGVGAYDLLWADAGPVVDGGVEVRW